MQGKKAVGKRGAEGTIRKSIRISKENWAFLEKMRAEEKILSIADYINQCVDIARGLAEVGL